MYAITEIDIKIILIGIGDFQSYIDESSCLLPKLESSDDPDWSYFFSADDYSILETLMARTSQRVTRVF